MSKLKSWVLSIQPTADMESVVRFIQEQTEFKCSSIDYDHKLVTGESTKLVVDFLKTLPSIKTISPVRKYGLISSRNYHDKEITVDEINDAVPVPMPNKKG